ncbi:MAG TPA: hypothetical protein VIK81_02300 [Patescibacteria group bacterium]
MSQIVFVSMFKGFLATSFLLVFYFTTVTLISGWDFAQSQFFKYWYFIVSLAFGFGIQITFYFYLRDKNRQNLPTKVLATSGTTSAAAMVSCCSHYLVNILPIIGISGFVSLVAQYQPQLFLAGLAFNIIAISFMINRIIKFGRASSENRS